MPSCVPRPVLLLEDVEGLGVEYCNASPEDLLAAAATSCSSSVYRQRCNSIVSQKRDFKTSVSRKTEQRRAARRSGGAEFEVDGGGAPIPFATTPPAAARSRGWYAGRGIEFRGNRDGRAPFTRFDPAATAPAVSPTVSPRSRRHWHLRDGDLIVAGDDPVYSDNPTATDRLAERRKRHVRNHRTSGGDGDGGDDHDEDGDDDDDNFKSPSSIEKVPLEEGNLRAADPHFGCRRHETGTPGDIASRSSSLMVSSTDLRNRVDREEEESESKVHRPRGDGVVASRSVRIASAGLQRDVDDVVNMVCRLHSRLSDAACWTRNLQADTRASRHKVASLVAQVRQLSQVAVPTNTGGMAQRPLVVLRGKASGVGGKDNRLEKIFNYSSGEEVGKAGDDGDCGIHAKGRGSSGGSGETNERVTCQHASPLSSPKSCRSRVSSRSSSPAVSARISKSNSPISRPGSPMSQGSGCGSMAPMYSPVALTEADCLTAATSADGIGYEFNGHCAGGSSAADNTNADAGFDSEANPGAYADGGEKEVAVETIEGPCCIQDIRDGYASSVHNGRELTAMSDEGIDVTHNRAAANGDGPDTKKRSSLAESRGRAPRATKSASGGGDVKTGTVPEREKAEAKQQPFDSSNGSKRRGEGKSRSRSPRRRKKPAVDNNSGKKEGRNRVPASTTILGSPGGDNRVSASSPRGEWGRQGRRGGMTPRSEQGSPREYRRGRRRGKGNYDDDVNGDSINNDRKKDLAPRAGSKAASKARGGGAGANSGVDGGAGGMGAWEERGAQQHNGEARVVAAEEDARPDPMEAGHMLQALSGLSTTLRRLSCGGNDAVGPAIHDAAFTAAAAGEVRGTLEATTIPRAPCERCLLLSERLEDLRERARVQQRLLEHSDKLLGVATATATATATTTRRQDIRPLPAGQLENSEVDPPAAESGNDKTRRAAARRPTVIHEEGSRKGERQPSVIGQHDARESGGGDAGPSAAEAAAAVERAAEVAVVAAEGDAAAVADEENEALLTAAEEVWRISEMARDALEAELERKEEALSAAAKTATESKEHVAEQAQDITRLKAALQSQERETEKWKGDAEKSISKEKDARRAMESSKVAAADVLRRSEREGKALRAEANTLNEKVTALRTRLAGMQARRQAERELAGKKTEEQMLNTAHYLDPALDERHQHQQRQQQRHHPFVAFRRPSHGNDHGRSSTTGTRRYSSAPRGVGESSLTRVREMGRRRTNSSPAEIEAVAEAAAAAESAAAAWNRRGSGLGGGLGGAHATTLLYEEGHEGTCDESGQSLSHEEPGEDRGLPWSPSRQAITGEDGSRRTRMEAAIMASTVPSRAAACLGVGRAREMSATPLGASPSRRMSSSTSPLPSRSPWQHSSSGSDFAGAGRGGDSSHGGSGRGTPASQHPCAEGRRGGRGDRRTAASGRKKSESIMPPTYAERSTQAARQADIERVLRRASQSHPPPTPQRRDDNNTASTGSTDSAASNTQSAEDAEINTGRGHEQGREYQVTATSGDHPKGGVRNEGNPPNTAATPTPIQPSLRPREEREDGEGGGGGGGGGGWRGLLMAALLRKEKEADVDHGGECIQGNFSIEAMGKSQGDCGDGDNGVGTGSGVNLGGEVKGVAVSLKLTDLGTPIRTVPPSGKEREEEGMAKETEESKNDHLPLGTTERVGEGGEAGLEAGGDRSGHGGYDVGARKQIVVDRNPSWKRQQASAHVSTRTSQKKENARASENDKQVRLEKREESPSPPLFRTPPPDFWKSVEEAGLSTAELEGVVQELTEEEAERLLRDKGMIDVAGNVGT